MNEVSYLTRLFENVKLPVKPNATASSIYVGTDRYQLCFILHEPWEIQLTYQLSTSSLLYALSKDITKIIVTVSLPSNNIYKVSTYSRDGNKGDIGFGIGKTVNISLEGLLVFQHLPGKEHEFADIRKCKKVDLKQGGLIP